MRKLKTQFNRIKDSAMVMVARIAKRFEDNPPATSNIRYDEWMRVVPEYTLIAGLAWIKNPGYKTAPYELRSTKWVTITDGPIEGRDNIIARDSNRVVIARYGGSVVLGDEVVDFSRLRKSTKKQP